jgi:hypothetical protein
MKNTYWFALAGIVAATLPAAAGADWRFTKWGMSVEEVMQQGRSADLEQIKDDPDDRVGSLQRLALGKSTEAGIAVRVEFYFDPAGDGLQMVRFAPLKPMSCFEIEKALIAEHGKGQTKSNEHEIDNGRGGTLTFTMASREWGGKGKDKIGFQHAMKGEESLDVCPWFVEPAN